MNDNIEFSPAKLKEKTNNLFLSIMQPLVYNQHELKQKAYMDLTGRFPHKSSRGNSYLFVLYDYNTNAILFEPLKTRQAREITTVYEKCVAKLSKKLLLPKIYIMDNECSIDLKKVILKNNGTYELVPSHQYRRNSAEKAIRTLKNHLLSDLATCDTNYPIHEWDRLLPQCELTLNFLHNSRINPKLSSWVILHGIYNFNKVPFAPPGTRIVVHNKPNQHHSWQFHGTEGWYIGPTSDQYRCLKCYLPIPRTEIMSDTIHLLPQ